MREYSNMDTPENKNSSGYNEELLSSFVDGELSIRQQTEVRRLMKNDSEIFRRVQQLQKCKMLISSMPKSKAPDNILSGVTASLIGKAILAEKTPVSNERAGRTHLLARKVVAAVAMLSLAAVLMMVVYIILSPVNSGERIVASDNNPAAIDRESIRIDSGSTAPSFHGRLELKAANLVAVDSFINRAIEESGMSDSVSPTLDKNTRIYSLKCSKDELDVLLSEMEGIWNEFDTTKLFVETETFGKPVAVETVNTKQIAEIVNQESSRKIIEVAKDYAVLNGITSNLPGDEIVTAIDNTKPGLVSMPLRIPKPLLTGERPSAKRPAGQTNSEKNIHLTIVLNR